MQPQDWQRLASLWDRASQQSADELPGFLAEVEREDPVLRPQLERLLASARDDSFLDRPFFELQAAEDDPWQGKHLGLYRLRERIGVGGMSFVYRAERADDEFDREVAVKLLQGVSHPNLERRLLSERQILAQLDHSNIARLYDGGTSDEGVPFVVMELVRGMPITTHCQQHGLNLAATLKLYRKVCDAVQYAHRHLVVHRDLKPANILVNEDGEPKLLDFGLAKLLQEGSEGTPTQTLYRALTPGYASPEQIAGRTITIASDIYSLGVLLYELLTGTKPFDLTGKSPAEIERLLDTRPPRLPSETPVPDTAFAIRRRLLVGDLDRITLEALVSEPEQRYPSVAALSDDIGRYLAGQPVRARPNTWGYRASKLVARNRLPVALAGLLAASMTAFGINASVQAHRLANERNIALQEQQRAEEAVVFLEDIFKSQDPRSDGGQSVAAKALLDTQRERIEIDLADQPDMQARLYDTLATVYNNLGSYPEAEALYSRTLALRRQELGDDHPEVGATLGDLGVIYLLLGDNEKAEASLREAIELLAPHANDHAQMLAQALHQQALVLRETGDLASAEASLRQAFAIYPPGNQAEDIKAFSDLATIVSMRGDLDEAEKLTREALARIRQHGASSLEAASTLNTLGEILRNKNSYDDAEQALREALGIFVPRLGDTVETGATYNNLGAVLRAKADFEGAAASYREALRVFRKIHGDRHPFVATIYGNLGRLALVLGKLDEADANMQQALGILVEGLPANHPNIGLTRHNIARLRRLQGRLDDALRASDQALEVLRDTVGEDHVWITAVISVRGAILLDRGDLEGAQRLLERSLASRTEALGRAAPAVAESKQSLARLHRIRGENEIAARLFAEAAALFRDSFGASHPDTANAQAAHADTLRSLGHLDEAAGTIDQALEALRAILAADHWNVRRAEHVQAAARAQRGDRVQWEAKLTRGFEDIARHDRVRTSLVREAALRMTEVYRAWNDTEQVAHYLQLAANQP